MSTPAQTPASRTAAAFAHHWRLHLPTVPEAVASLLRTVVVALFLLTFVLQPFLIPSESMEHTLLVGDFLLVNKQIFAPQEPDRLSRLLLPYRDVERGDVVVFHHPRPAFLVKRVVGIPGRPAPHRRRPRLRQRISADEPYAAFEPAAANPFRDDFPAKIYTDPEVDPDLVAADAESHARRRTGGAAGRVLRARRQSQSQQGFPLLGLCAALADCGAPTGHLLLIALALPRRMCNRPRMIDSDTTGNSRPG